VTDEESFDALYVVARERLVAQIYLFTGDAVESADLVQNAFEKAWRRWDHVSVLDEPEAWVRLVAFNLAKNHRRWQRHVSPRATVVPSTADPIESEEGIREVGLALLRLPINHRRALILHHVVGLSVREVATEMAVAPGTVMSWLHRGRQALAVALREFEPNSHGQDHEA
jgi:RNA polymerase sigma-70 factor (ECF subfamily)